MSTNILFQDSGLQGCDTVLMGEQFQMFRRTVLASSSSMKQDKMIAHPEHWSTTTPWNIRNHTPSWTTSHPKILESFGMCCENLRSCKYVICLDTSYMCCVSRALGLTEHTMFAATWRGDRQWNGDMAVLPGSAILTAHSLLFTRPPTELWHKNKDSHNPQHNWNITTHTNKITKLTHACRNTTFTFPGIHNWFLVYVLKQIQMKSTRLSA